MASVEQHEEKTQVVGPRLPDMSKFVEFLQARRAETENPKHAAMLDVLIEHSVAEVRDHDIERTMATLVDDCVYHYWGNPNLAQLNGGQTIYRDTIRENYLKNMAAGVLDMDSIEVEVEHFFINDDAIAWDGWTILRFPGTILAEAGVPLPDGGTPEDFFIQRSRQAIVIPFRDGLMVGEDFYTDGQGTLEKI